MKRTLILTAIVGLLLGTMMILPALGKHKQRNDAAISTGTNFFKAPWAHDELYGLELGAGVVVAGAMLGVYSLKTRKA